MMLWATGCSHTFGDDLEDKTTAWPFLLADKLHLQCVNNAVSGGSNDRIMYEVVKADPSSLVVISWSYIERFTRYNHVNYQINFNPQLCHHLLGNEDSYKQYGKMHYAHWHNELYAFKLWLQQIIFVQTFFKNHNQPYIMFNAAYNRYDRYTVPRHEFNNSVRELVCFDQMNDRQLEAEYNEIEKYTEIIDYTCFYDMNFHITDLHSKFKTGETGHLLEEGHEEIAQRIYEFYV